MTLLAPAAEDAAPFIPVWSPRVGAWRVLIQRRAMTRREIANRYDEAAAGWSALLSRLGFGAAYRALMAPVAEAVALQARDVEILDCGAGDGALSAAFAAASPRSVAVTAVDLSPRMLAAAEKRLSEAGVACRTRVADARALPFEDDAFAAVVSAHMLEHLADPEAALREMARVTRPGGLVAVCVTRRSLAAAWIQLRWGVRSASERGAMAALERAGLCGVRILRPAGNGWFARLSIACVGAKPLQIAHEKRAA